MALKPITELGHPNTLMIMNNLASTYMNQGHWKKAEELQVDVMERRIRVLGEAKNSVSRRREEQATASFLLELRLKSD
ncbi:hypothetical protein QL093DRAFT_2370757 [Fusarium oxysporum]|nr:hypothetical protein QL093DRAFT_2370757 [Fusarium oxysporum]